MTYKCPKGHDSTDPDYCSECGTAITASPLTDSISDVSGTGTLAGMDVCPDCQTPREGGLQFCEVCRYDFISRTSFSPNAQPAQIIAAPPATPPAAGGTPVSAPQIPALPVTSELLLVAVSVDPSLDAFHDSNNPAPADGQEFVFHLDLAENVVGRESGSLGIHPEIPVSDKGVSRRHLKFLRNADGTYSVLELGSANGTLMNGQPLLPGASQPIKHGDEFVVGSWTRLSIRNR